MTSNYNPLLARRDKNNEQSAAYRRSHKQEKAKAKKLGAYCIPGSGNGLRKGDVRRRGVFRIEAKTTSAGSFRLTREMVDKLQAAAIGNSEVPVIYVEFLDEQGKPTMELAVMLGRHADTLLRDKAQGE